MLEARWLYDMWAPTPETIRNLAEQDADWYFGVLRPVAAFLIDYPKSVFVVLVLLLLAAAGAFGAATSIAVAFVHLDVNLSDAAYAAIASSLVGMAVSSASIGIHLSLTCVFLVVIASLLYYDNIPSRGLALAWSFLGLAPAYFAPLLCGKLNAKEFLEIWVQMKKAPAVLPRTKMLAGDQRQRWVFWGTVLFLKWMWMIAGVLLIHTALVRIPVWIGVRKRSVVPLWVRSALDGSKNGVMNMLTIFLHYHAIHNGFLYALSDIAIVNDWLSERTGLDFELWSFWVDWVWRITFATVIIKYSANFGGNYPLPVLSVALQLLPGLGCDIHLAKDWTFIGICFSSHDQLGGFRACVSWALGILSLLTIPLPIVVFTLKKYYCDRPHLATAFVFSHLAGAGAEEILDLVDPADSGKSSEDSRAMAQEMFVEALTQQSTPWHWEVAMYSEVPQLIWELIYSLLVGFKPTVLAMVVVSAVKALLIPVMQDRLPGLLVGLGSGRHLAEWAKTHGHGTQGVLYVLFRDMQKKSKKIQIQIQIHPPYSKFNDIGEMRQYTKIAFSRGGLPRP